MQAFPKLVRTLVVATALVLPSIALAEPAPGPSEHPAEATKSKAGRAAKSHDKKEHKEDDAKKHAHDHAPKPEAN